MFLRHLANHTPETPVYAFVDLDPDGIAIMSTYKYGSYRLAHEDIASKHSSGISIPSMRWLGIKQHHISSSGLQGGKFAGIIPDLQGLMRLTIRDRKKATQMLNWDICCETGPEQEWRHELQMMLTLNIKAEIQILDELPEDMVSFLSAQLNSTPELGVDTMAGMACSDDGLLF